MASGYCVFIVVCVNHPYRVRILNYTRDKLVLLLFHNLSWFFFHSVHCGLVLVLIL